MVYKSERPEPKPSLAQQNFPSVHTISQQAGSIPNSVGIWVPIRKLASEARPSTTTLINDGHLFTTLNASQKYLVRAEIWFDADTTGDFKWSLIGPASPTLVRLKRHWIVGNGAAFAGISVDSTYTAAQGLDGTTGPGYIAFSGLIHNGINAGTFAFQWSQNVSNAFATTVLAGSYLDYMLI